MATKVMTIKLMIDPKSNTLIFAESSKDFVDFLIYLLALPIGTVTKLLTSESMVGSIGNVYTSVARLDEAYWQPNVDKYDILYPMVFSSLTNNIPLSASTKSSINSSRIFYTCWDPECKSAITNASDVFCPGCDVKYMNQEIKFIDKDTEGYVQNVASYMITDDLSITSISTMSIVSMMNKFNVSKLEEREVKIGTEEALELLKTSLQSTTVLTDVFVKRKKRKNPGNEPRKIRICVNSQTGHTINFEVEPSCPVYRVMARIEEIEGFPPKNQALLFERHRLRGERTFADYNVVDGSVIDLMIHLKGC